MSRILLIDVDSHNFPNLVLMKLSAYHKNKGNNVSFVKLNKEDKKMILIGQPPWFDGEFDKIYAACVFSENKLIALMLKGMGAIVGGTGIMDYDNRTLSYEIEHTFPDYSLYKNEKNKNTAYGFLTRGCPRGCKFCIVGKKEGFCSEKVAELDEFWNGQKYIKLLDANILAYRYCEDLLEDLANSGAYVDFTQGIDARCANRKNLSLLRNIKIKRLHWAWDNPRSEGTKMMLSLVRQLLPYRPEIMKCYVLTNYWSTFEEDLMRVYWLRENGFDPYIMIYDKYNAPDNVRKLQRWVNNKRIWNIIDRFEDYDCTRG